MGLVASMEKKNSEQKDFDASSINAVKSSLMGPLAGIGDSIFWGVLRVIAAGIAVGLGASGNVLAPIVFLLLFNIPSILVKYYGTFLGYKLGSEYIQKVYASGLMNILTKAASIVGLIMVGGMTASMVTFNSTYELTMKGESVLNLQNMLDQIFIGIVPLGLTLLCYYLLKRKYQHHSSDHRCYHPEHPSLSSWNCINLKDKDQNYEKADPRWSAYKNLEKSYIEITDRKRAVEEYLAGYK